MKAEEYKNLKRFNKEEHTIKPSSYFNDNDIFEIYTMKNVLKYFKIKASYKNLFYDLTECSPEGENVRCPYTRNCTKLSEILERINENDWRLFKKTVNH